MPDTGARLTLLTVSAAALTVVLTLPDAPARPSPPPPDFGTVAPVRDAAATRTASPPPREAGAPRHDPPPERIMVRGAGLDAPVRPVGVTGDGAIAVPADPAVAGWYRHGPAPGASEGAAVLVGHMDDDTGALGEFAALYDIRPGDRVEVRRTAAEPVVYRVVARATTPKDDLPPDTFRRTGAPVLRLVTCAPPFVPGEGGYRANLVVTAEPLRD
ncbi:class F sortase [Streptomyces sp. NPDC005931]|uniref:class F sortase n=1 Tax=Streptomyces sp. NPDC005931 TaxID=3364737 RepID=UPI0036A36D29